MQNDKTPFSVSPLLGENGPALLELWKAQIEWAAKVAALLKPSTESTPPPQPNPHD
jgi:hypothetical protein